jgi:hypothetical protein
MQWLALLLLIELAPPPSTPGFRQPQMAPYRGEAALTFGAGKSVYFARTVKGGASLGSVVKVADAGALYLGQHRGPHIAVAGETIVITAVTGQKGRGQDGDVVAWRSANGGKAWSEAMTISQPPGVAREGLHGMAARGSVVFVAWIDLREKAPHVYGAVSRDAGATWSPNVLVYKAPSGAICECCHPTVAINRQGQIVVMFRNALDGNRDMYVVRSTDGGLTFSPALKLGEGVWPLKACPMDGGDVNIDDRGEVLTIWRRDKQIFLASIGGREKLLGEGKNPSMAVGRGGVIAAWESADGLVVWSAATLKTSVLDQDGKFPHLITLSAGKVLGAWESKGMLRVEILR